MLTVSHISRPRLPHISLRLALKHHPVRQRAHINYSSTAAFMFQCVLGGVRFEGGVLLCVEPGPSLCSYSPSLINSWVLNDKKTPPRHEDARVVLCVLWMSPCAQCRCVFFLFFFLTIQQHVSTRLEWSAPHNVKESLQVSGGCQQPAPPHHLLYTVQC